jgi:hypothetical protein
MLPLAVVGMRGLAAQQLEWYSLSQLVATVRAAIPQAAAASQLDHCRCSAVVRDRLVQLARHHCCGAAACDTVATLEQRRHCMAADCGSVVQLSCCSHCVAAGHGSVAQLERWCWCKAVASAARGKEAVLWRCGHRRRGTLQQQCLHVTRHYFGDDNPQCCSAHALACVTWHRDDLEGK